MEDRKIYTSGYFYAWLWQTEYLQRKDDINRETLNKSKAQCSREQNHDLTTSNLLGQKKKKKRFLIPEILKIRQAARDFFFFFFFFFKVFMYGCRYIIEDLCTNGIFIQSQQKHFIERWK